MPPLSLDLSRFYPRRSDHVRKGDFGRVVVAGGSERYAGCLAFNALAALRTGADLAIVVAPRRAADIVAGYSPDLITIPCDSPFPDPPIVSEALENSDSLVLGCGVIRSNRSHAALQAILRACKLPTVADAETLHALAPTPALTRGKKLLLTPNAGEFQILSGGPWPKLGRQKEDAIRSLAKKYSSTVIVKGAPDYISDGNQVFIDEAGSPYLTKGGYGDLLAGTSGALLARGVSPLDSARGAAFLVGNAGRIAAARLGEGTLASDALSLLPSVLSKALS